MECRTENDRLFSVPSPNLAAGGTFGAARVQEAGRFGPLVLRLVRKDCYQQAGQVKLSSARRDLIRPNKRAVSRSEQKLCIDQRAQQAVARQSIETP